MSLRRENLLLTMQSCAELLLYMEFDFLQEGHGFKASIIRKARRLLVNELKNLREQQAIFKRS
jgi:hypothetical protein